MYLSITRVIFFISFTAMAMSIALLIPYKLTQIQVPGVEADDVIGTLAVRSVNDGFKVDFLPPFEAEGKCCWKKLIEF